MDTPKILYSEDAEKQIIGICLVNPQALEEIELDPQDFYIDKHRIIYTAMRQLQNSGTPPDYVTLCEWLERQDKLKDVKSTYLVELIGESGLTFGLESVVKIVQDYGGRRRLVAQANTLVSLAYDTGKSFIDPLANVVDELVMGAKPRHGAKQWSGDLSSYYDWLGQRAQNPGEMWGIQTGVKDFDKITGGLQPGELVYIAGEPGIGKSILSIQMAVGMAEAGHPGCIYSLEMSSRQLIGRIISARTRVQSRKMKSGRMNEDEWQAVTVAIESVNNLPLYISDDATLTTAQLRADLARNIARNKIEWCVLDYDMLLQDGDGKLDEIQFSTLVSKRLKNIARDLNIAMLTVSSVTKEAIGDEGKPSMRNIRGGAQKLHNADVAGFLTNHIPDKWEKADQNLRTLTFVKGRELTSLGSFHLVKFADYPAFGDYAK